MSADHLALAQRFFGSFAARDTAATRACLAPDATWHVPGATPISRSYHGADEVLGYFASLQRLSGGTWRVTPLDMLVGKSGVVLLARGQGEREGRAYDATYCLHLRMEGGLIREARLYNADQAAFDAFWA